MKILNLKDQEKIKNHSNKRSQKEATKFLVMNIPLWLLGNHPSKVAMLHGNQCSQHHLSQGHGSPHLHAKRTEINKPTNQKAH
jgi:hypothetical protein